MYFVQKAYDKRRRSHTGGVESSVASSHLRYLYALYEGLVVWCGCLSNPSAPLRTNYLYLLGGYVVLLGR